MAETKFILNKDDLVRYMMQVHNDEYNGEISRIKLQKGLYFLFAFWAEYRAKATEQNSEIVDLIKDKSDYLFDADFKAWVYGPVDTSMYSRHKLNKLVPFTAQESNDFMSNMDPVIQSYLYSMTRKIFNSSDFGLVDLSHRDKVWSNKFDPNVSYNDEAMTAEAIINEYKNK